MEYRGIKLADSVRLYKKDGSFDKNVKRGLDSFVDLLEENEDQLLNEYIDDKTHLTIKLNHCNHGAISITPNNYKKGKGCKKCSGNCREQAKEELIILLESNGHKWVNGDYINARSRIYIDFNCGHKPHWTSANKYKQGRGCPKCMKVCSEQAKEDFIKLLEYNGHKLLSEYIKTNTKVLIDFNCGHRPHWIKTSHYKDGHGCPICKESKGEKRVRRWLEDNIIIYEPQMEYDGLLGVGGKNLSYDFYLPKQNILIEYQGEFHDGTSGWTTDEEFEIRKEHDKRKREYTKIHNIELLEIWYWDFDNVEEILQREII